MSRTVSAAVPLAPRYPLLSWRIGFLGVLLTPLIPGQNRVDTGFYCVLAIAYAVAGTRYGTPRLWWMGALTLIPVWLWTPGRPPDFAYPLRVTIILGAAAGVLYAAGRWHRDRLALTAQRRQTREQADLARRRGERSAVLAERARIALAAAKSSPRSTDSCGTTRKRPLRVEGRSAARSPAEFPPPPRLP